MEQGFPGGPTGSERIQDVPEKGSKAERGPQNHADWQAGKEKWREAGALHAQQERRRLPHGEDPNDGRAGLSAWQEGPKTLKLSGPPGEDNQVKLNKCTDWILNGVRIEILNVRAEFLKGTVAPD